MIRAAAITIAAVLVAFSAAWCAAKAHDGNRPDLDGWYGGLKAASGMPCCSKRDCHVTEAEIRKGEWWARLGKPASYAEDGSPDDWELLDFVKIPDAVVLRSKDNPTGEAVICHPMAWNGVEFDPSRVTVWCFVEPDLA